MTPEDSKIIADAIAKISEDTLRRDESLLSLTDKLIKLVLELDKSLEMMRETIREIVTINTKVN